MAEPTEAAFNRADVLAEHPAPASYRTALARYLQEVSDAAKVASSIDGPDPEGRRYELLAPFILPEPVDPLRVALNNACPAHLPAETLLVIEQNIRRALQEQGLKIVEAQ